MQNKFSSFLAPNTETEEYIIAFLLKNQKEAYRTKEHYFFDPTCKIFYQCIKDINETEFKCSFHLIYEFAKKKNQTIDSDTYQRIVNTYTTFDNVNFYFNKLKDIFIQNEILKKVESIIAKSIDKKDFDKQGIKELSGLLESDIVSLGDNEGLLDTSQLTERYRKEQQLRQTGERKRSLGFAELDKYVTRTAAPEEITILLGFKGFGKSAFKLSQENNLINDGICVVSFNPEMPTISNTDRLVGIRSGISIYDLIKKDKDQRLQNTIERELKRIEEIPNFLYIEEPSLNIYSVLEKIRKAKQIFSDRGVLPDDEYMFVTFDTFDMLEEFENADPKKIKSNVNQYHRKISRKEKIHSEWLLQANENKIRGTIFKKPDDLDFYKFGEEDIEGGAAYSSKARVVMSINRPVQMKKKYFPDRMDEWNMELDLLNLSGVKQNDGPLFFTQFSFNENMRIYPHKKN